jgi:transposase
VLARQYSAIDTEIASIDKNIMVLHRACEASQRLAEIPGIGPISATALVAEIGDWKASGSGRCLATWIGLVPKQYTTGGKDKLGRITKQGNRYLRWLLIVGAMAVIRYSRKHGTEKRPWLGRLMERRPPRQSRMGPCLALGADWFQIPRIRPTCRGNTCAPPCWCRLAVLSP